MKFPIRANFCKQAFALAINIKNHFSRVVKKQADPSILNQVILPFPMKNMIADRSDSKIHWIEVGDFIDDFLGLKQKGSDWAPCRKRKRNFECQSEVQASIESLIELGKMKANQIVFNDGISRQSQSISMTSDDDPALDEQGAAEAVQHFWGAPTKTGSLGLPNDDSTTVGEMVRYYYFEDFMDREMHDLPDVNHTVAKNRIAEGIRECSLNIDPGESSRGNMSREYSQHDHIALIDPFWSDQEFGLFDEQHV